MNVLHILYFAGKSGSEKYVYTLIKQEKLRGIECAFVYDKEGPLCEMICQLGVPVYRLPMRNIFDLRASKRLAKLCEQHHIDVIHTHFPRENCIAILACLWRKGMKVVNTSHLFFETGFIWRNINRIFSKYNSKVICVCHQQVEQRIRNGVNREKICVIHNGVPPAESDGLRDIRRKKIREEFGIRENTPLFCAFARFEKVKGIDILLNAAAELQKKVPDAKILIAGDGSLFEDMKQLRHKLQLDDMVIMAGYRKDSHDILAASDVYVSSSRSEALSFAIIEAMSTGLPVIISDAGGNPDILENSQGGLIFQSGDHLALAQHMETLAKNKELRSEMSRHAQRRVADEFSEEKMVESTIAVYHSGM